MKQSSFMKSSKIIHKSNDPEQFLKFFPENSKELISEKFFPREVKIVVTNPCKTKYGSFTPAYRNSQPCIRINNNLKPYSFLLVYLHEYAHFIVWKQYKTRVKPHGYEWKTVFKNIIQEFIYKNIFPDELLNALNIYSENISAKTLSNKHIKEGLQILENGGKLPEEEIYPKVKDTKVGSVFVLQNSRTYKLIKHNRSRSICLCLNNNKKYSVPFEMRIIKHINC